ncbi:uncharacterized protein LOC116082033 isoform X2 [Mastomys coucha]|uniref:uncharacterized protein LOC116082033 isoform X2 n=1 Tax=Mastomys coucha TaxID=35658 RepID=UPI001262A0AD|nr:uncharacterized protein LOC116082033 isoform X2 [Mastomys coucha]
MFSFRSCLYSKVEFVIPPQLDGTGPSEEMEEKSNTLGPRQLKIELPLISRYFPLTGQSRGSPKCISTSTSSRFYHLPLYASDQIFNTRAYATEKLDIKHIVHTEPPLIALVQHGAGPKLKSPSALQVPSLCN